MEALRKRRWLGDQMVAAIGLLVAAAMAALLSVAILVAGRVDNDNAARETDLVQSGLVSLIARIKNDLSGYAPPDAAYDLAAPMNARWIHRHYGSKLYQAGRYDRAFVIDESGATVYAAANGQLAASAEVDEKIRTLVRNVRVAFETAGSVAKLMASDAGEAAAPPNAVFRSMYTRIEGRPAIIAAFANVPLFARDDARAFSPPIAAVVAFFDRHLLAELETELSLASLHVSDSAEVHNGEASIALPLDATSAGAWLHWASHRPGSSILGRISPALGIITLLFGFVTLVVMRSIRSATQSLAVSERRAVEMAYRDPLTGLANRLRLVEELNKQIPALGDGERIALFFLDLDGFKDINDTLGHPVGDELLAVVGERLEGILGSRGLTVRFGGDEFALAATISDDAEIARIAEKIIETVRQPATAGEHILQVGVTMGVSVAPEHGSEPEELLRRADIALYRAKAQGRGSYQLFNPDDETVLQNRRAIERDIERALWHDEFFPLFQPLYSADGERVEAVETLVRWQHPERGMVPPADFIHVAEKCGLIVRLDEWVLRKACEHALAWPDISVAVNMSPSNFRQSNLAERVKRIIEETGFDPRRLEIEITEGMLLNANEDVMFDLQELREYGVRIAIDDFGTGYSSLGYLGSFPVDKIKIDKSFVQNLGVKEDAAAIVECVARLGRALGLSVTAEGVETPAQHRFVRAAGCQQIQGFLFSKPVRPAEILPLLQKKIVKKLRA